MSFLTNLMGGAGGAAGSLGGGAAAGVAGAMGGGGGGGGNPLAAGLGKLIGSGAPQVQNVADRIGMGANQIAAAGGAQPGYAPPPAAMQGDPNNHLQLLDPQVLHALIQKFSNPTRGQNQMEQF